MFSVSNFHTFYLSQSLKTAIASILGITRMEEYIYPVLLLSKDVTPTAAHLPLLRSIQKLLNESYTKALCAHSELFDTPHVRLADPAQLGDIIGDHGFTIILVRVSKAGTEVVATGSVKDFGDGDIEMYAQWSKNLSGTEWAAKNKGTKPVTKDNDKDKRAVRKYEVTAIGVTPNAQSTGLGTRILKEIEWLVSSDEYGPRLRHALANDAPRLKSTKVRESQTEYPVEGIDLNALKELRKNSENVNSNQAIQNGEKPKLVLMIIKELGNEGYYQRRGFKSIWTGTVPLGMWDCKKECTLVYMEKDI